MNILIFTIGFIIFITYMFFLLRMVNRAHKHQERAQGKYKYKTNTYKKMLDAFEEETRNKISNKWDS